MKKLMLLAAVVVLFFSSQGCLVVQKMKFEIDLRNDTAGVATAYAYGIASDAIGNKEYDDDVYLLSDMLTGTGFLEYMENFGRKVIFRELTVDNNSLNGKVVFTFDNIVNVENIIFDGEYYYLTLPPSEVFGETNGLLIQEEDYQRVIWGKEVEKIEFELLNTSPAKLKDMIPEMEKVIKSQKK